MKDELKKLYNEYESYLIKKYGLSSDYESFLDFEHFIEWVCDR